MSEKNTAKTALEDWIGSVLPILDSSLDAVAVVDSTNGIYYANSAMKSLLKLRPTDLKLHKKFCDCITLSLCEKKCQIMLMLESGKSFRFDESPSTLPCGPDPAKLRVSIRGVAVNYGSENKKGGAIGGVVTLRDTSAEILVQAKYHKLAQMVEERDAHIEELRKLNAILRRKI